MSNQVTLEATKARLLQVLPEIYKDNPGVLEIDANILYEIYNKQEDPSNVDSLL